MATDDFFRARLDSMIDLCHPLAVLAAKLPWPAIEAALAAKFAHHERPAQARAIDGLFGVEPAEFGGGVSRAGRPHLPIRLMSGLLYLKNSFDLSDEELVQRWTENVYWQHFCGLEYFEPRLPCDARGCPAACGLAAVPDWSGARLSRRLGAGEGPGRRSGRAGSGRGP